jgi:PAS domain S-box-containing protein
MKIRAIIIIFALLAFLTASIGGYYYYYSIKKSADQELSNDADAGIEEIANRLGLYLADLQKNAAALAGIKELRNALESDRPDTRRDANAVLDHFQHALEVDICYLIDRSGTTIASSNRETPESYIGKNFAFRPYFNLAMGGTPGIYPALGVFTGKRGVFYSHPVYVKGQAVPAGIVVIKASIDAVEKVMDKKFDGALIMADPKGVIFSSTRGDWLYHVLWKIPPDALSGIVSSRQFGKNPPAWTGMERLDEHHAVDPAGRRYVVHHALIRNLPGWELIYLRDMEMVSSRVPGMKFRHVGFVILIGCALIGFISVILYRNASNEIRKRRVIEEELQGINHRLHALINASPLPITIIDLDGKCLLWNPAAEQVFGWTAQEVLGKPLPIIPDDRREEFRKFQKMNFEGRAYKATETQRLRRDGALIDIALSTAPLRNAEGVITEAMGIFEDLTDRKKAEEERLKGHILESIGILAGGLAHDFNNLLTIIIGNIAVAKMTLRPGDKAYGRLDDAENVCGIAAELSQRLITFATGGDPVRKIAPFPGLLRDAVNIALKVSNIHVEFNLPDELSLVAIDEGQIKQVFVNLVINAREAMPHGGTLTIQGENLHVSSHDSFPMREGDYVKISIRDTGAGIPAESLSKIFDPYYSTKDTYSQKGLGLGLAVCYSIIRKHDGLITAESQVGKGTTFSIYLTAVRNG